MIEKRLQTTLVDLWVKNAESDAPVRKTDYLGSTDGRLHP